MKDNENTQDVDGSGSSDCSPVGVDCLTDGHRWYSKTHPSRCVEELLFGGYAMYERVGDGGLHRGVCSDLGAYQWLSGEDVENVDGRLKVVGVTVECSTSRPCYPSIGQRVRWVHDLDPAEVDCDIGILTAIRLKFAGTPIEQVRMTIRFDRGVLKTVRFNQIHELDVDVSSVVALDG